ncbi:MAG TPA: protein translocase subunit SecD [Patescibacteria group bacterium]|nr:protein translocase subunit SecD [Patescibacteria group bacterium]
MAYTATKASTKQKGHVWFLVFLVILVVASLLINLGPQYNAFITKHNIPLPKVKELPFRLGLDLSGGTSLTYDLDLSVIEPSDRLNAAEGARDVIERRVNMFGVSEPNVQVNKTAQGNYQITVELAGVKDINEAIKEIGETPLLQFKELNEERKELTDEEKAAMDEYNKKAEIKATEVLGKVLSGGNFAELAKTFSEDEVTKDNGGSLGWLSSKEDPELIAIAEKLEVGQVNTNLQKTSQGYEIVKVEDKRPQTKDGKPVVEIKAAHLLICYEGASNCQSGLSKEQALEKINRLKEQATPENFSDLVKQNSTEPGARDSGGELGWFSNDTMVKEFEAAAMAAKKGEIVGPVETEFGYHLIYKEDERPMMDYKLSHILIKTKSIVDILGNVDEWKTTELTGKYLKRATVQFNPQDNTPEVALEFDSEGAKLFEDITGRNINKPVAIFLDGYMISQPTVNEKITGGQAVISGRFSLAEAKTLAQRLNAGALPVPITLVNQQTIGASLGQSSVNKSLTAGIVGLILVALFMIIVYRLPGLLSVIALLVYGSLTLSIFKVWPVTLTLSGIAGFILSIGMAVDANVLIFERMKEELRAGKPLGTAINEGFSRAWPSIRDGNLTTLIICFILIQFLTGSIKGFAITLALGVLMSMFSAVVVTRNLLKLVVTPKIASKLWLFGVKPASDKQA